MCASVVYTAGARGFCGVLYDFETKFRIRKKNTIQSKSVSWLENYKNYKLFNYLKKYAL
jgi:hypothetical protein